MRAQCCICSDLFENSNSVNIAAAPCGHTFHESCLMRWMETSSTCPSCRTTVKKNLIIKRLYFDACDEVNEDDNTERLLNQIGNLKATLREKERKESDLKESVELYKSQLVASELSCDELTVKLKSKQDQFETLQKSYSSLQRENSACMKELNDLMKAKKKLSELQNIESIVKGCDVDIKEMISQYSDGGESSLKTVVSMLTVLKQEYNKVLGDKKNLLTKVSTLQKKIGHYHTTARHCKEKEEEMKVELDKAYESLSKVEKENNDNRRKLVHLRNALRHNKTEGSQSFHRALTEDSPNVAFTPPPPNNSDSRAQLASTPLTSMALQSPDLFAETPISPPQNTDACSTPNQKLHKFGTSKEKCQPTKKAKIEHDDAPQIPSSFYSIMQKKMTGVSNSRSLIPSVITRGYDGFGGSTKFVHSLALPTLNHQKINEKKVKKQTNLRNQLLLNNYINRSTESTNDENLSQASKVFKAKQTSFKLISKVQTNSDQGLLSCVPKLNADSDVIDLT